LGAVLEAGNPIDFIINLMRNVVVTVNILTIPVPISLVMVGYTFVLIGAGA